MFIVNELDNMDPQETSLTWHTLRHSLLIPYEIHNPKTSRFPILHGRLHGGGRHETEGKHKEDRPWGSITVCFFIDGG